jgi:tetratricopeptide (TPR) repeat protein
VPTITKKVRNQIVNGSPGEATEALIKVLSKPHQDLVELSQLGKQLMDIGRFDLAGRVFARWSEIEPKNVVPWSNLGGSLARLKQFDQARTILDHAINLNPGFLGARINLCSLFQDTGEYQLALDSALAAVKCDPSSSLAFNNLGSALRELGMLDEAKHAFETSLMLSKDSYFAKFNLAKIEADTGNHAKAIPYFEELIAKHEAKNSADVDAMKFALGFEYLKTGRLAEGWKLYESGFSENLPNTVARHPLRKFVVPKWDGSSLQKGQRLMVWREQGIGDEVMFGACLKLLESTEADVILEVDQRLATALRRSFPKFEVRGQYFAPEHRLMQTKKDYDYQISFGSLCQHFLRSSQDLDKLSPYLHPDEVKKQEFADRLAVYGTIKKVGICWRSGSLSAKRNSSYTHLDDWGKIFSIPGVNFVNLQYGECEEELKAAEEKFGIKITRWDDVNLKEDLESVFAIIANLDAIVSVGTSVVPFSGALGVPGIAMLRKGWTLLGSTGRYPWFPSITTIVVPVSGYVAQALPAVPAMLEKIIQRNA